MPHQVSETIPSALSERVDAAVAFFNDSDLAAGVIRLVCIYGHRHLGTSITLLIRI